ncbi:MAG: M16 family metallopeptidase, partial [Burkholderiales bacterium]
SGGLPSGKPIPSLPEVKLPASAETKMIPYPSSQSHILIGYPGVTRDDPDYFPLLVGNYVLGGGGFESRLLNEVREKRGLAYSVYSYFYPLERKGPFEVGLQTRKDQTREALAIVRKTLGDYIAKGPTPKEIIAAKENLVGGFPLRIDSNRKIVDYLAMIGFYHLPLTYLDDFTKNVDEVTAVQIRDAFSRRINPANMVTVVVGAPNGG